jgi:tetratricopeptide (TPR) repeat protein
MAEKDADAAVPPAGVCVACREQIAVGARICPHCGTSQSRWRRVGAALKWIGGAVTVLSLLFGIQNLNGLYRAHLQTNAAVRELVAGAERLAQVGDYRRAWEMYGEALVLQPSSALVRSGQVALAMKWLPRARITGEETFSAIVDTTLPALTRGLATARGERAADLLALLGWAHYLERKERHVSDVDIPALYAQALQQSPDSIYAHTFLGHWLLSEELDLDAGLVHFQQALALGREREFVRRFQWAALRNVWHRTSSESPEHIECLRASLRMADDMRRNGEALLDDSQRSDLLRCYGERMGGEGIAEVLPAMPLEEHEALLTWLLEGFGEERPDSTIVLHGRFVRARIREELGKRDIAIDELRGLDPLVPRGNYLRQPLDEALERLTGTHTDSAREREDPLEFHGEILRREDPAGERFGASLEFVAGVVDDTLVGRETAKAVWATGTLEAVRARLAAEVQKSPGVNPGGSIPDAAATAVRERLQDVRDLLGRLYLATRNLDGAIVELEALSAELEPGEWARQGVLYNLACAYSLRAGTHGRGPAGQAPRAADIEHGMARLEEAIQDGYSDWDHIKHDADLDALRDQRRYRELMAGR